MTPEPGATASSGRRTSDAIGFSRVLGPFQAVALGLSVGIGVGGFAFFDLLIEASGGWALLDYLLAALLLLPLLLSFAERVSTTDGSSGLYTLARSTGSTPLTFAVGWLKLAGYLAVTAILTQAIGERLALLLGGSVGLSLPPILVAAGILLTAWANESTGATTRWRSRSAIVWVGLGSLIAFLMHVIVTGTHGLWDLPLRQRPEYSLTPVALLAASLWSVDLILTHRGQLRRPHSSTATALLATWLTTCAVGALAVIAVVRNPDIANSGRFLDFSSGENLQELIVLGAGIAICAGGLSRLLAGGLRLRSAMLRDGFLPGLGPLQARRESLSQLLLGTVALAIVVPASLLPSSMLFSFAATAFLWSAAMVLTPYVLAASDEMAPRWRLPLHPLVPGFAIAGCIYLSWLLLLGNLRWIVLWPALGFLYYMFYARRHGRIVRHDRLTFGERTELPRKTRYRVLVAAGDGRLRADLIRTGARIAQGRGGELLVLAPLTVNEHTPFAEAQEVAATQWNQLDDLVETSVDVGIDSLPLVRLAPRPSSAILETAAEYDADLVLLDTHTSPPGESVVESVLSSTLRSMAAMIGEVPAPLRRILVATAGGPHAPAALEAAVALAGPDTAVTLMSVASRSKPEEHVLATLRKTFERAGSPANIELRIVRSDKVKKGILEEARNHDLVVVGASVDRLLGQTVATGLPIEVAYENPGPTLLVKRREPLRRFWKRRVWEVLLRPLPTLTVGERAQVFAGMRHSARADVDYYVLITLASTIAIAGLMLNSGAVIIGAMLVAPLMNPILALAHGIVQGHWYMTRRGAISTFKGTAVAIGVGTVAALLLPQAPPTVQILARSEPNLLDLVVAIAAGAAAAYGISRSSVSAALPGVAISVALVPPLCVVGWGLGQSRFDIAGGAMVLYLTNLTAIVLVGVLMFLLLGFRPSRIKRGTSFRRSLLSVAVVILGLAIPLGMASVRSIRTSRLELQIESILGEAESEDWDISDLSVTHHRGEYLVRAIVYHYGKPDPDSIARFHELLEDRVGVPVSIRITVIEAELVDQGAAARERIAPVVEP